MELAEIREPDQPGFTRRLFSDAYRTSRARVAEWMAGAGLAVSTDSVGNLFGQLTGAEPGLAPIVVGSHTDTVAGGGRFDGTVGVLGAIELARLIREAGLELRHPLRVADFLGEEPNRFGLSCLGSRAVAGQLSPGHLDLKDGRGQTLGAALGAAGTHPEELAQALWGEGSIHCYLELHIEQGRSLERSLARLGVVTVIAGISRAVIRVSGRQDHAGTTTMADRRDALAAAAETVLLVERLAQGDGSDESGVGTVGRLEVSPGATNVVPGGATLWAEFRSSSPGWLDRRQPALEAGLAELGARRGVELSSEWVSAEPPTLCAASIRDAIGEAITQLGEPALEIISGASHDAVHLAHLGPMGMIFIPSREGRSHCPEEWTDPDQVATGVAALLATVLRLDGQERL